MISMNEKMMPMIAWKDYTPGSNAIELCPWDEDIASYVADDLPDEVSDKLKEHLGRCSACADRERRMREKYEILSPIFQPTDDEQARWERFTAITQVVRVWQEDEHMKVLGSSMWAEVLLRWQLSELPSPTEDAIDDFDRLAQVSLLGIALVERAYHEIGFDLEVLYRYNEQIYPLLDDFSNVIRLEALHQLFGELANYEMHAQGQALGDQPDLAIDLNELKEEVDEVDDAGLLDSCLSVCAVVSMYASILALPERLQRRLPILNYQLRINLAEYLDIDISGKESELRNTTLLCLDSIIRSLQISKRPPNA